MLGNVEIMDFVFFKRGMCLLLMIAGWILITLQEKTLAFDKFTIHNHHIPEMMF